MAATHLLFFGDQLSDSLPSLQNLLLSSKSSPATRRFLQEATDVIQTNAALLKLHERKQGFALGSLQDIAETISKQDVPDALFSTALMCVVRLGELIRRAEAEPSILGCMDSPIHVIGLCTGLLPAAVVTAAKDTSELLKIAVEVVAVSFRLGHETDLRSKRIEDGPGSWAYTIVGVAAAQCQEILDEYHQAQGVPIHKHVYVSVSSRTWTTVFGPPSTLTKLWSYSPKLEQAPKLNLGSAAAVHAAHLPSLDVEKILGHSAVLNTAISSKARILSTKTCEPFVASNLRSLLYQVIHDIAQNTYDLDNVVQATVSGLLDQRNVNLVVVGPTAHASLVQGALQGVGVKTDISYDANEAATTDNLRGGSDLVAIVGMSGRFPGSDNIEEFWQTLKKGQEFCKKIPKSRFDIDEHYDPDGASKNTITTQYGCFLDKPGLFDCRLFNVSPREATQMDPFQRMLLMTTYEALETAGYAQGGSLSTNGDRVATYIGQTTDDWRANNECQGIDVYFIPAAARSFTSGRLNYHFKWAGASYNLDSACSSSSTAIALACSALNARECDTALAGGGSLLSGPSIYAGLSRGGFLSTTGGCKTFSDDADGYCRGEGVGVVVLKRLEDAIADNDNVQAVIRSSARSSSPNAPSITQPDPDAQKRIYKRTLQQAYIDPTEISYVEMHGTGTQLGDSAEVESVAEVFGKNRTKENPLVVGAVKANVGHGEAAAGVVSLIKMVMMLRESSIPPQPGMPIRLNRKFPPLDKMNIKIASGNAPLEAKSNPDGKRKLFLNNFDAAGGNTCLIIEDPPQRQKKGQDPRSYHVVTCSGRTLQSLKENKQRLIEYLGSNPKVQISDIAYTTTARRLHDVLRASFSTDSIQNLSRLINEDLTKSETKRVAERSSIVFAFTGQGSLYSGMAQQLFRTCPRFKESIHSYQAICDSQGLPSVVELISNGDAEITSKTTEQSQLAIVFLELALADLWKSWGVEPDLVIGHSLGEYAALCISGVLSVSDTLHIVGRRAQLIGHHCSPRVYGMLAVQIAVTALEEMLASHQVSSCVIAGLNAPNMTVASGKAGELQHLQSHLDAMGIKSTPLPVTYGFHSPQMDPVLNDLEASCQGIYFAKPVVPIASTLTGSIVRDAGVFSPSYLARQARNPVDFIGALQTMKSNGLVDEQTLWMEIGPDAVCLGLIRSTLEVPSSRLLPSIKTNTDNWKTITSSIATLYTSKAPVNWPEYHRDYASSNTLLQLPTYAFDLKDYWIQYRKEDLVPATTRPALKSAEPIMTPPLTTCLQYIEEESFQGGKAWVKFFSYTSDPMLLQAIQGHLVDGVALCPASVFSDMALTAAKYVYEKTTPGKSLPTMEIWNMEITHAISVPARKLDTEQVIEVSAAWTSGSDRSVKISFSSKEGSTTHKNGDCQVRYGRDDSLKKEFAKGQPLMKKRMSAIMNSAKTGAGQRLVSQIVYKLFSSLVFYDEKYRSIQNVYLEDDYDDAVASVKLRPSLGTGRFTCSPYWIDAIVHVAGFLLNGNPEKPNDVAYISTGFESMRIVQQLSEEKQYTSYVSMQATEKSGITMSDVYVFDGERLVAVCAGILFQMMNKTVLHAITGKATPVAIPRRPVQTKTENNETHVALKPDTDSGNTSDSIGSSSSITQDTPSSETSIEDLKDANLAEHLLALVASETGYDIDEMEPSTLFTDMGVDSLMSIAITSAVKREFDVELPASFFNTHSTVADVRKEFGVDPANGELHNEPELPCPEKEVPPRVSAPAKPESSRDVEEENMVAPIDKRSALQERLPAKKKANRFSNVVLVQGRATSTETPLFLVTDGAGSATAYLYLPSLPNGRRIYAVESPFLNEPEEYTCSMEDVAHLYLEAIRKTQPQGPYILGGWSAGAAHAFEVTAQLIAENQKIQCLFLLDMHVPKKMKNVLTPATELIEETNKYRGNADPTSPRTKKMNLHLLNTVKALIPYNPGPLDPARSPAKTVIIWAKRPLGEIDEGTSFEREKLMEVNETFVGNDTMDAKTRLKSWFFGKRVHFGPHGWDKLIQKPECHIVDADHLSMVKPPVVKHLGELLARGIEESAKIIS